VRALFHKHGSDTVGTCRTEAAADVSTVCADPRSVQEVHSAVESAAAAMGGLDSLVIAHALPVVGGLGEQSMEDFWCHVDDALTGSFLFATAAAEVMRSGGSGGRIVLTTSRWHVGGRDVHAVAAASGGIIALTKTLTRDLGRLGIGVNAVAVGGIESEWSVCDAAAGAQSPPLGTGSPEKVAEVVYLLCQPDLRAAVGQIVNVDGGLSRNRV
jgi:NAD(P)-dependent dehydrogenase (short-subunit alcohol dehydrogenase family)